MLFDKDFALRHMVPAALFFIISLGIMHGFGLFQNSIVLTESRILLGIFLIGIASWIGGACLFMLNTSIIRLMEGYGRCNPARLLLFFQKRRYMRMKKELSELDKKLQYAIARNQVFSLESQSRRNQLSLELATRFPDDKRWVLPTAFGNTIRAFEAYPRVMYGLESIQGWARLLAVIPKEYRELVDETSAPMHFWINIWVISILVIAQYNGYCLVYGWEWRMLFIPFAAFAVACIASRMARNAASDWGEWVKAAFDVFLPELWARLGFLHPDKIEQEQQIWVGFSQAIIYRSPSSLVAVRNKWRAKRHDESLTS